METKNNKIKMDWKLYASITLAPLKKKILMFIYNSEYPVSSVELSEYFGKSSTQMCAMLREFKDVNIIDEISGRKRNTMYEISKKGKELVGIILKKEKYINDSKNKEKNIR